MWSQFLHNQKCVLCNRNALNMSNRVALFHSSCRITLLALTRHSSPAYLISLSDADVRRTSPLNPLELTFSVYWSVCVRSVSNLLGSLLSISHFMWQLNWREENSLRWGFHFDWLSPFLPIAPSDSTQLPPSFLRSLARAAAATPLRPSAFWPREGRCGCGGFGWRWEEDETLRSASK